MSTIPIPTRLFDGFHKKTGRKTKFTGVRIYLTQFEELTERYPGNISVLMRLFLDRYLAGELPELQKEFEQLISN